MKVIGVMTFIVSVSALLSCADEVPTLGPATGNSTQNTQAITVTDVNNNTVTPVTNGNGSGLNPPHGQPSHRCDIAVGQPLNSKPATQPSTLINPVTIATPPTTEPTKSFTAPFINPDVKSVTNPAPNITLPTQPITLNPPHGKPGHRCDIQVGQPLNSKPLQTTTSPAIAPITNTTTVTPITNTTNGAPRLNPKHGQPGHRCDILVGQPLDSKPSQPTTAPATTPTTNTSIVAPTANTATATPTTNTATVAPWLNPKHGQPGHRCDILVGQPLNSKPAQTSSP